MTDMQNSFFASHSVAPVTIVLLSGLAVTLAKAADGPALSLRSQSVEKYKCDSGKTAETKFYELSDQSLSFIKLTYDGKVHTLPNLPAASGMRFSDEIKMEWHEKAGSAVMQNLSDPKQAQVLCSKAG
jgi:membrane-bound inhibitor of C-type lysozyme